MLTMIDQHARRRHWLLQAVLLAILALVMAAAQWLRSERLGKVWITLGEIEQFNDIALRRPFGWVERYEGQGVILEESPRRHARPRRLSIWWTWAGFVSPTDFLIRAGHLPRTPIPDGTVRPMPVAGWPGIMVGKSLADPAYAKTEGLKELWGCTILPTGQAVLMRLTWEGAAGLADEDALCQVASSLRIRRQPEMEHVEQLDLWGGIRVNVPTSLSTGPEQPPFHDGRVLITSAGGPWLGVDLAPLVWTDQDGPQTIAAIMLGRDRSWSNLTVKHYADRAWIGRRADDAAAVFVLPSGDGLALLAEFRWDAPARSALDARVEPFWKEIARGVKFTEEKAVAKRIETAAAAIKSLPPDAMEILDGVSSRQVWEWFSEDSSRVFREVLRYSGGRSSLGGTRIGQGGLNETWRLARDWRNYTYRFIESESRWPISQETRIASGVLETINREGPLIVKLRGDVPQNFLPGAALRLVMGRLPREPMVFASESVIRTTPLSPLMSLTLIVEPAFDVPRYPATEPAHVKDPLPCWSVRINGSSRSSRWYLDQHGQVEAVWFADGLRWHRVDEKVEEKGNEPEPGA